MAKTITIKCDNCGDDLSASSGYGDRNTSMLVLTAESIAFPAGTRLGTIRPYRPALLAEPAHFCNFNCLNRWSNSTMKMEASGN